MSSFFTELKRRNVFRVAIAYAIIGWLLVEVASVLFPTFEAPAWVMKVFATVVILGFPLAIVFAWIFEMTPEGLKRETEIDRSQSITPRTGRKLDFIIIGLLSVALIFFVSTHDWGSDEEPGWQKVSTSNVQSIAVLPFVNISGDPQNEYFSDGISEELLNVLVKVQGLKVASRTSSFAFKGKDVNIPEIAEELKVDHILEGSVRKAGNTVRITAQLIDVRTDRHLWSETYDRELEDIFAIQDEISHRIVDALKVALGAEEEAAITQAGRSTENLEAYELYLQGRYFWQRRGEGNILKAIDLFERATRIDSQFARAWSSLAAAHTTLPTYSDIPEAEHWPHAETAARQALELDDSLAEAYAVLGDMTRAHKKWMEAENYYLKAIENEPKDPTSHLWYGEHLTEVGRTEDALDHTLIAYELDPLHPGTNANLTFIFLTLNDLGNAMKHAKASWDLGHVFGLAGQGEIHLRRGEYDEALRNFEQFEDVIEAQVRTARPLIEALTDPEKVPAVIEQIRENETILPAFVVLPNYVELGYMDEAYRAVDRFVDTADAGTWGVLWDVPMASFRKDPRFEDLVTKLGLLDYWQESGVWPDTCQPPDGSFACQ